MSANNTRQFNVLVIDDDSSFFRFLENVGKSEYIFHWASCETQADELLKRGTPDLILVDLYLGKDSGLRIYQTLRNKFQLSETPVMFLSGSADGKVRAKVFEIGASDFIAKPFFTEELFARMSRALSREYPREVDSETLRLGSLSIEIVQQRAYLGGRVLDLTALELELLSYFVRNPHKLLTREDILRNIWKETKVASRTVDTHISNLRKKLGSFEYRIISRYGGGYVLESVGGQSVPLVLSSGDSSVGLSR